jgi:hypothetical protein
MPCEVITTDDGSQVIVCWQAWTEPPEGKSNGQPPVEPPSSSGRIALGPKAPGKTVGTRIKAGPERHAPGQ